MNPLVFINPPLLAGRIGRWLLVPCQPQSLWLDPCWTIKRNTNQPIDPDTYLAEDRLKQSLHKLQHNYGTPV